MAGYSGTPLAKKLGIKADSLVALLGAPTNFTKALTGLPPNVRFTTRPSGAPSLVIWFVSTRRALDGGIGRVAPLVSEGVGLWVAWPKQASGLTTDLRENIVREVGLSHDLVDYKVCAIDATWSGLKFARRRR